VQRWLELETEKPIIYLSLGTMVTISEKLACCLIKAVKKLRCRVLWVSKLNSIPKNYQTDPDMHWSAWVPQPLLLANPRVKCFVSHAGSGAVQEALWFAKPMLCIPQIWDQSYNAWVIQALGVGRVIDKRNFSEAEITQYLVELLGDSGMQKNSKQYSQEVRTLNTSQAVSDYILSELGPTKPVIDAGI
jgi:glucuronosyltransferase